MSAISSRFSPLSVAHFAFHARLALFVLLVAAAAVSVHAEDWIYKSGYMTNSLGWKIKVNTPGAGVTTLSTVDNDGMVKGYPATGDRPDGRYTLDLSQPIIDCDNPSKTYTLGTRLATIDSTCSTSRAIRCGRTTSPRTPASSRPPTEARSRLASRRTRPQATGQSSRSRPDSSPARGARRWTTRPRSSLSAEARASVVSADTNRAILSRTHGKH